MVDRRRKRLS